MAHEYRHGDTVEWNTLQGKTRDKVKKKRTSETGGGGQKVNSCEEDLRYLVDSEKSSHEATHKPDDALSKA